MHMFLLFPCYTQHAGITTGLVFRVLQCLYKLGSFVYIRGAQPFWAKSRSVLFLVHSRAEEKNYKLNFQESSVKNRICFILLAFLLLVV